MPSTTTTPTDDAALDYRVLQGAVGLLAVSLPFVTACVAAWFFDTPWQTSISAYYYTRTGGWFVGSLCAMGLFFATYHVRKNPRFVGDRWFGRVAAIAAVTVALCPTTGPPGTDGKVHGKVLGWVHLGAAGVLFATLGLFALVEFTKTEAEAGLVADRSLKRVIATNTKRLVGNLVEEPTRGKQLRNRCYRVCGAVIFACIGVIIVENLVGHDYSIWFPETIATEAFGFAWLVKSHWIGKLIPALDDHTATPARRRQPA